MPGLTPPPGGWGDGGITVLPAMVGMPGEAVLILFGDEKEHASRRLKKRPVQAVSASIPLPPGAVLPPSGGSWFGDWSEGWLDIVWYGVGGGGPAAAGEIWWAINEGRLQGTLNVINGLQQAVIGALNMSPNVLVTGYQIPNPDWAEGMVFDEDPLAHDVSMILGGEGLLTVLTAGLCLIGNARHLRHIATSTNAARATTLPEGSFSIVSWNGYPAHLPKPTGPFRLLEGAEYNSVRVAANQANRALHQADPALRGLQIHEIQPVKFGGSPTDPLNKIPLTPPQHSPATTWWTQLQRDLERTRP